MVCPARSEVSTNGIVQEPSRWVTAITPTALHHLHPQHDTVFAGKLDLLDHGIIDNEASPARISLQLTHHYRTTAPC